MRGSRLFKILFSAVGALLLAGAAAFVLHTRSFISRAASTQGVVVDLAESRSDKGSRLYRPVVSFTGPDGREIRFTSSGASSPPAYDRGEVVEVLYDPARPGEARIRGFLALWLAPTILGGLGAVFSAVGVGATAVGRLRARRGEALRRTGTRVEASFQRVALNRSFSYNGRHPFRVVSQWLDPATNQVHVFESEDLWFDPTEYVQGRTIPVYVERGNPRRYHVDLSFLPKLAS